MGDLTTNFNRAEFACKGCNCCGNAAPVNPLLVRYLQGLRDCLSVPLFINSGFRCVKHNRAVGGTPNSQHVYGVAADVATPQGLTAEQFAAIAESLHVFDGIGLYDTFVHLDVRGSKAKWDYRTKK